MLAEIIITVASLDEAVAFYTDVVGLDYLKRVRVDGEAIVLLGAGPARVALVEGAQPGIRVAFATDDIGADHRRLDRHGITAPTDPTRAQGGTVLPFADPWGNPLALWETA